MSETSMQRPCWRELVLAATTALVTVIAGTSGNAQTAVTWGKPSEVLSTDPHTSGDGTSWTVYHLIYEQLLAVDDNLQPAPALAERWEQLSPTSYLFHLRRGSTFSNGRPVVAADVVGSLNRLLSPELGAAWGRQLRAISEIVAVDDHTLRIDLSEPLTPLLSILAVSTTSILPMAEMEAGTFDPLSEMMGSGPFRVREHRQDEVWVLERNPHYWRTGYPLADEFHIRIMPDDTARIAALREGQVDMATFENPDTPRILGAVPGVDVHVQATPNYFRLDVSGVQENSPFTDIRLRQAMAYALDRERIVDFVFGGNSHVEHLVPAVFGPPEGCTSHPAYALPRDERQARARALLAEAGRNSLDISIIASSVLPTYSLIAQVIQADLQEVGINARIEQIPAADWYARVFSGASGTPTDFNLALSWFAGYGDPAIVMNWWAPGISATYSGFVEPMPEYTEVISAVRELPAGPDRDAAMARACQLVYDGANMLPLVNKPDYVAYRSDLVDVRFAPAEGGFNVMRYAAEFDRR